MVWIREITERKICVGGGGFAEVKLECLAFIDAAKEFSEWWYHFMLISVMYEKSSYSHP